MRIEAIVWLNAIIAKLAVRHHATMREVEEVLTKKCLPTIPSFALLNGEIVKTKMSIWHWGKRMPGAI